MLAAFPKAVGTVLRSSRFVLRFRPPVFFSGPAVEVDAPLSLNSVTLEESVRRVK